MTRFNVGGQYLDLPSDINIQYKAKNILFAFDKIEVERTASFNIPSTPHNETIMQLASDVHGYGMKMRKKLKAQLQDGVVAKDGYIYASDYDCVKKCYSAIFVTGDLLKLKDIKDAGKISSYLISSLTKDYTQANQINANTATAMSGNFECVKYKQDYTGLCKPSILLSYLINQCASYFGVNVTGASVDGVRLIPAKLQTLSKKKVNITSAKGVEDIGYGDVKVNQSTSSDTVALVPADVDFHRDTLTVEYEQQYGKYWGYEGSPAPNCVIAGWQATEDTEITLPDTMSADVYMVSELGVYKDPRAGSDQFYLATFYGDHKFGCTADGHILRYDTNNLAGRKVRLAKGDKFAFVNVNDISCEDPFDYNVGDEVYAIHYENNGQDYYEYGQPAYELDVIVSHTYTVQVGSTIYLEGNLPDVTFVDLLKTVAALIGKQLYYDDANGIQFIDLNFNTWSAMYIKDVISAKKMSRTFSDYAQKNIVKFDSDSNVFGWEQLSDNYPIENEGIEEEKELQVIPFSETGTYSDSGVIVGYLRFNQEEDFGDTEKWGIMKANSTDGKIYMSRVALMKNAGVQDLCDVSSSIEINVKMPLHQYERITPLTVIWYNGTRYVWTEAQWAKNVATLKLSKI